MVAEAPELVQLDGSIAKALRRGRGALGIAADRATTKATGGHRWSASFSLKALPELY